MVLSSILAALPVGRVLFTSDWQFGPEWTRRFGPLGLSDFWQRHDSWNLYLNSAYALVSQEHKMAIRLYPYFTFAFALLVVAASSRAETEAERRTRILTQTKMNVVAELTGPASEFKGDGDPTTIEIVFLTKKSDGPSRVSDDGEVIFLHKAPDKTQQKLIERAFEIRLARAENET
jgi:hypothetical protein